jgi:hypothetical protein
MNLLPLLSLNVAILNIRDLALYHKARNCHFASARTVFALVEPRLTPRTINRAQNFSADNILKQKK